MKQLIAAVLRKGTFQTRYFN